jgi:pimeloyl-ACP methyl ester carboxylesterase
MSTEATGTSLEINGTRTCHASVGDGPPLLLLHGAEGSRKSFVTLANLLAPNFTVISYDQRDCGETRNPPEAATLSTLADDAAALLLALGHSKACVFGTSFGGRLAQALALRHPRCIERLILASTWRVDQALKNHNAEVVAATRQLCEQLPQSANQLAPYFFPEPFLRSNPRFRLHFASSPLRSDRSDRRTSAVADVPPLNPAEITAKTLVVAGELDVLVPAALTLQLARSIKGSRSTLLSGVGHVGHVQCPEMVATYIREFCTAD